MVNKSQIHHTPRECLEGWGDFARPLSCAPGSEAPPMWKHSGCRCSSVSSHSLFFMICCFLLQLSLTKSKDGECLEERSNAAVSLMLPTEGGPRSAAGTSRWWSIISRDVAAAAHLRYLETHRKISAESFAPRMEEVLRQSGCHGAVFSPVLVSRAGDFIYFVVSDVIHLIYKLVVVWLGLFSVHLYASCIFNCFIYRGLRK